MNVDKFIEENYPKSEKGSLLIQRYKLLKQLVENEFEPQSVASRVLFEEYNNDVRSVLIRYDFLEVENEVLIKAINSFCDDRL